MLALAEEGWTAMTAPELPLALAVAALRSPGGVILDARELGLSVGRATARLREACFADAPLVVLGEVGDESAALSAGADAFVPAQEGAVGAALRLGELEHGALPTLLPVGPVGTRVLWFGPAGGALYAALAGESDVAHAQDLTHAHELLSAVPVDLIVVAQGTAKGLRHPTDRDVPVAVVGPVDGEGNGLPEDVELAVARARALLRRRRHLVDARRAHVELGRRRLDSAEEQAVRSLAESRAQLVAELERSRARVEETAQRLREAHLAAERLASAKSRFLSSVSHELRTPLNAILGFGRVLEGGAYGPLNERQRFYLTDIVQAGEHMLRMVDDLLDLQRLDEGRDRYDPRPAPITPVIENAVRLVRPLAAEAGHALEVHVERLPECTVDARALLQILVNLLSNAVKFTPPRGKIEVSAHTHGDEVAVSVRDNGVGIAAEDHERIFEYFEQAVPPPGGPGRGSGIGLALVRALVRRLGGNIRLDSTPGKGSTFTFTLPVAHAAAEADREVS
jgi:signal transduction histidine kinase